HRFLGTDTPTIGVNFGRVGFLTSIPAHALEDGVARALAGDYRVVELPSLELHVGDDRWVAVNDVVATSATVGRMVELEWAAGGRAGAGAARRTAQPARDAPRDDVLPPLPRDLRALTWRVRWSSAPRTPARASGCASSRSRRRRTGATTSPGFGGGRTAATS